MLQLKNISADIGVIVGRFQVHELSPGHRDLIDSVRARHQKVAILVGSTPGVRVTRRNPLDYQTRRAMLQDAYPDIIAHPLRDQPSDAGWVADLELQVQTVFDSESVVLYGARDSFVPAYRAAGGRFPVVELEERQHVSGTAIRRSVSMSVRSSAEFRHGVVYAAHNRHPVMFPTVDVATFRGDDVLLIKKATETQWRFPGGFVDPVHDASLEAAARREVEEETGVGIEGLRYIGSHQVDDWRYRDELDGIMTTLFAATYVSGRVAAGDDAAQADWQPMPKTPQEAEALLVAEHRPLWALLAAALHRGNGGGLITTETATRKAADLEKQR